MPVVAEIKRRPKQKVHWPSGGCAVLSPNYDSPKSTIRVSGTLPCVTRNWFNCIINININIKHISHIHRHWPMSAPQITILLPYVFLENCTKPIQRTLSSSIVARPLIPPSLRFPSPLWLLLAPGPCTPNSKIVCFKSVSEISYRKCHHAAELLHDLTTYYTQKQHNKKSTTADYNNNVILWIVYMLGKAIEERKGERKREEAEKQKQQKKRTRREIRRNFEEIKTREKQISRMTTSSLLPAGDAGIINRHHQQLTASNNPTGSRAVEG